MTSEKMNAETIRAWIGGKETDCPYCGASHMTRCEEDDGFDHDGHWAKWGYHCYKCKKSWIVEYSMRVMAVVEDPTSE